MERSTGWRLAAAPTLLSVLVSLGFSVASLVTPSLIVSGAAVADVAPFAGYTLSRSIAIALAAIIVLVRRSPVALVTVGWIATGMQAMDALVGLAIGDLIKAVGPATLAAFSAYALVRLRRSTTRQAHY